MIKIASWIEALQKFQAEHGDIGFCVEVSDDREGMDSSDRMIGNEIVGIAFDKDSFGDYGCLETVTGKPSANPFSVPSSQDVPPFLPTPERSVPCEDKPDFSSRSR